MFNPRLKPTFAMIAGDQRWRQHPLMYKCNHFWPIIEAAGSKIHDIVGWSHAAIITATPAEAWANIDDYGNSTLTLDGTDDYAVTSASGRVMPDAGSGFVSYIPADADGKQRVFGLDNNWEFDTNGSFQSSEMHNGSSHLTETGHVITDTPIDVCTTYNLDTTNSNGRMYINGVLEVGPTAAAITRCTTTTFYLGWRAGASTTERLHGQIRCAMTWERELSNAEVEELHDTPYIMFAPQKKYWIFKAPVVGGATPTQGQLALLGIGT